MDDPRGTALSTLGVDTDDGLVVAADVFGVQGQVGDLPAVVVLPAFLLAQLETLLDGVLVRAAEGAHDQGAAVGGARVHGDLVADLDDADDALEV